MIAAILSEHLRRRRTKRDAFIARPHKYKVCDQCRSISLVTVRYCPLCHCYRLDETEATVKRTAAIIGENPFPLTAGVVPRLSDPS